MPATHLESDQVPPTTHVPSSSPCTGDVVLREAVQRRGGASLGTPPVGGRTTRAIVERAVAV